MQSIKHSVVYITANGISPEKETLLGSQGVSLDEVQFLTVTEKEKNTALERAEGEYITFIYEGDSLSDGALAEAAAFLEKYTDTDAVALRITEPSEQVHILDYKFNKGERVIDLRERNELFCIQSMLASVVLRRSAVGDLRFDDALPYGADMLFVNSVLLKRLTLGVTNKASYHCCSVNSRSVPDEQKADPAYYLDELRQFHLALYDRSKALYGEVVPFVQSCVGYDLLWRFGAGDEKKVLSQEQQKEYGELANEICAPIDDTVLFRHPRHGSIAKKEEAAWRKYGENLFAASELEYGKITYKGRELLQLMKENTSLAIVQRAEIENNTFVIELLLAKWVAKCADEVVFAAGDTVLKPTFRRYTLSKCISMDGEDDYYLLLSYEMPLYPVLKKRGTNLSFRPYLVKNGQRESFYLNYGKFVPADIHYKKAYQMFGDYAVRCLENSLRVYHLKHPKAAQKRWDEAAVEYLQSIGREDVIDLRYRRLPLFRKQNRKKGSIWLISDRIDNAGDNGEVLFKYICEHCPKGVRPVFVIGEKARDEVKTRLRAIGEVVLAEDKDYPLYFLSCEKIISSSAGEFTINPFGKDKFYYLDLFRFKYYFMNHGVNCGDCSRWLNRYNKNIHIFFTTGVSERQNIINRDYNLAPEQVVITGLARFDALYEDTKKQLLILPSWRRAYKECYDEKTSSVYYDGFKETKYYQLYNGLMNSKTLLDTMRRKGYTGLFCLHPIFKEQAVDFVENDVFRVNKGFVDYNKVFAESSVMVTDYSTIAFDFAYLGKPVVYTQFDREAFYREQIYDECFDYQKEGFGPVCDDLESAVSALCELMENDGENPYKDRIDAFFVHRDKNNAKRILEAVLADDTN